MRAGDPEPVQLLRMRSFDLLQELHPRVVQKSADQDRPVAIVDIDEESLAALGQWPWPRTRLAELVDRLAAMGVAVIGFDMVFPEPDRASPGEVAGGIAGLPPDLRAALAALPGNDAIFAAAMARSHVVLGQTANDHLAGNRPADAVPLKAPLARLGGDSLPFLPHHKAILANLPVLEAAASGAGLFSIDPDPDGILRRVPLVTAIGSALHPALALEMLRVLTGESVALRTGSGGIENLLVGPYGIPVDERGRIWVHYRAHDPALYVSVRDVLAGTVPAESLAGKLVLIGTSAAGLVDIKATPIDPALPGVEIHAQLLETILGGEAIVRPDWADGAERDLTLLSGFLMILLVPASGATRALLALGGLIAAIAGTVFYLYARQALLLDASFPVATAAILYSILVYAGYSREERQRREIRSAFGQYLSPALVAQLAADPARLRLGGERRRMSFLFSDIRGFTAIAENFRDDPAALTTLLNRFMTPMTNRILACDGTIDKYIGDAIMALWNAPLDDPHHARNACRAALGMLAELDRLNAQLATDGAFAPAWRGQAPGLMPGLMIGIGINTGECVVGNLGSELRFDYSVLGDAVNLAARLEGQSKLYGVAIVIGEATALEVPDFALLELDLVIVAGRSEATRIFALLGNEQAAADSAYLALCQAQGAMLAAYRAQRWQEARACLGRCRETAPFLAALHALYEARISAFETDPPPPGWAGIHLAASK